ncbi:uncharacterized protein A4U43_C05F27980 [Asparagus officinalis]|uniref:Cytochrome b561 domain-containing protein n=1 Tax=Asparagus officinalis TaxID=4686 RepID=A0A5P1EV52_ASPOF|nr:cytochrome b561 and DOMON domain-containing protein At3g25290-like [Asparagus officinalis]ONK69896.1 uncharacterized protein A4U43_C05F27980 [Asparagus officinalis]
MLPAYPLLLFIFSSLGFCQTQSLYKCDESFSFITSSTTKNITGVKKLQPLAAELGWNLHITAMNNITNKEKLGKGKERLKTAHGVLSFTGWGFLPSIGIMITRYFRSFPFKLERWFVVHVSIQLAGYSIGTAAWGIGLSLNGSRHSKTLTSHKIIGILIFCLATLQITALWIKANRDDKYRKYWRIYHHSLGYALVALAVVNIFKGLAILRPPATWKWVCIGILIGLACVALFLEITTWVKFYWPAQLEDESQNQSQPG